MNTQDFIDYGFEAEFIGRLPVRVVCEKLEAKDFVQIMKIPKVACCASMSVSLPPTVFRQVSRIRPLSVLHSVRRAENTGARALMTVCESLLRDFKFELPGTAVSELTIDADLIDKRDEVLAKYRELGKTGRCSQERRRRRIFIAAAFYEQHAISSCLPMKR